MVQVNENYLKLKAGYLFPEIAKRVKLYSQSNKSSNIIKLGIGDVTEPLPKACRDAMAKALDEMESPSKLANKISKNIDIASNNIILSCGHAVFHDEILALLRDFRIQKLNLQT